MYLYFQKLGRQQVTQWLAINSSNCLEQLNYITDIVCKSAVKFLIMRKRFND